MFFDILSSLCSDAGITPTKLVMDLGISKSNVTNWRIGKVPKSDTVQKIAAYFGVSTDYLLGNTDIKNKPAATEDDELLKNPEDVYKRQAFQVLRLRHSRCPALLLNAVCKPLCEPHGEF